MSASENGSLWGCSDAAGQSWSLWVTLTVLPNGRIQLYCSGTRSNVVPRPRA